MINTKLTKLLLFLLLLVGAVFVITKFTSTCKNTSSNNLTQKRIPQLSLMPFGNNPKIGSDSAKVKMIVLIDYQCFFCKKFLKNQLKLLENEYIKQGELQLIFKDLPLNSNQNAIKLARKAHLMYEKGKFEVFLNDLEVDSTFLEDSSNLFQINSEISESIFLAGVAGIQETPTFIINNRVLKGYRDYLDFQKLIDYNLKSNR